MALTRRGDARVMEKLRPYASMSKEEKTKFLDDLLNEAIKRQAEGGDQAKGGRRGGMPAASASARTTA